MIDIKVTSSNNGVVKRAPVKHSELSHATKVQTLATMHKKPNKAVTIAAPSAQKKRRQGRAREGTCHTPHRLHQACRQEKTGRKKMHLIPQHAVPRHHGETTARPNKRENHQPPTALHHLEILAHYVTTIH